MLLQETSYHEEGDRHLIGESLPPPNAVSPLGKTGSLGISPFPARSDHVHQLNYEQLSIPPVAAANWSLVSYRFLLARPFLQFYVTVQRTTSALAVPTTGGVGAVVLADLPVEVRGSATDLIWIVGGGSRMCVGHLVPSTGRLTLSAVGGTINVAIGEQLSLGGLVLIEKEA